MDGSGFPPFVYLEDARPSSNDFVARISHPVIGAGALLTALSNALRFPDYFGGNWDALDECMSDLADWIPQHRILLLHDGVPQLPRREQVIYLSILRDAILCLGAPQDYHEPEQFSARELVVAFPAVSEARIAEAWVGVKRSDYS